MEASEVQKPALRLKPAVEGVNIGLFIQLSPNVRRMSRITQISIQTIYNALNGSHHTRPGNAKKINDYLRMLFNLRMKSSRALRKDS